MRLQVLLALGALSLWSPARGEEEITDLDDIDDEDDGDLDARLDAAEQQFEDGKPKVPQDRMKACFLYTFRRARHNRKLLEETVTNLLTNEESKEKHLDQETSVNTVLFSWMMTCYMNINQQHIATSNTAELLTDEIETDVFIPRDQEEALNSPQAKALASTDGHLVKEMIDAAKNLAKFVNANGMGERTPEMEARWKQLSQVLVDPDSAKKLEQQAAEQLRQQRANQEAQQESQSYASQAEPKQFGLTYVICVFGVLFGLGALAVKRLTGDKGGSSSKERSAKWLRKEEKAKRELAKKQK